MKFRAWYFLCSVVYDVSVPLENNVKLWIDNVWHTNFIFKAMVLEYWMLVVNCNEGFARDFEHLSCHRECSLIRCINIFNSMQYFSVSNCDQLIQRNCNGHERQNAHKRNSGMAAFFLCSVCKENCFLCDKWICMADNNKAMDFSRVVVSLHIIDQSSLWYFCHVELFFFLIETMSQILNAYCVDTYMVMIDGIRSFQAVFWRVSL